MHLRPFNSHSWYPEFTFRHQLVIFVPCAPTSPNFWNISVFKAVQRLHFPHTASASSRQKNLPKKKFLSRQSCFQDSSILFEVFGPRLCLVKRAKFFPSCLLSFVWLPLLLAIQCKIVTSGRRNVSYSSTHQGLGNLGDSFWESCIDYNIKVFQCVEHYKLEKTPKLQVSLISSSFLKEKDLDRFLAFRNASFCSGMRYWPE